MKSEEVVAERFDRFRTHFEAIGREVERVVIGQSAVVEQVLLALVCQGHVLLEGVPGLGKTLLVQSLSRALDLRFSRIQCTPDLMPADVIGSHLLLESDRGREALEFREGPIFAQVVLVDEINRATPKTQSAFLEAMQERQVTVLGETRRLGEPFFLIATQNPIELEGTYPLPEAQLDRFFFRVLVPFPSLEGLETIVDRTTGEDASAPEPVASGDLLREMSSLVRMVKIAQEVKRFAIRLAMATHPDFPDAPASIRKHVRLGSSPRGAQSLVLAGKALALSRGRYQVSFDDVRDVAVPALAHRLILGFEAGAEGAEPALLVRQVVESVRP
jgi:MoxR-like ATPase